MILIALYMFINKHSTSEITWLQIYVTRFEKTQLPRIIINIKKYQT